MNVEQVTKHAEALDTCDLLELQATILAELKSRVRPDGSIDPKHGGGGGP